MKRKKIIASILAIVILSSFTYDLITAQRFAKETVTEFFACFENIFNAKGSKMNEQYVHLAGVVGESDLEMPTPNFLSPQMEESGLGHILTEFSKSVASGDITNFGYKIISNDDFMSGPAYGEKGGKECTHIQSTAQIIINNKPHTIYFSVNWVDKKITFISDTKQTPSSINIKNVNKPSIEDLRLLAAKNYTNGNYNVAYQKYLEIINQASDGDAYYRLAVMTYFGDGGSKKMFADNKERYKKVDEYLDNAIRVGSPEISRKAKYMKYNIQ